MQADLVQHIENHLIASAIEVIGLLNQAFSSIESSNSTPTVFFNDDYYVVEFEITALTKINQSQKRQIKSFLHSEFIIRQPQLTKINATFFFILKINSPSDTFSIINAFEI